MTLREKLVKYMTIKGYKQQESPSKKYLKFSKKSKKSNSYIIYWVGKNGALRRGRTSSKSISVSPNWNMINEFLKNKENLK
jgi:hypothetical protein